ncbi:Ribosome biogenesis protein nsa2 [Colletotrichum siamense]|uniref:Ribosome biogenesis protein nsa2 n=1 Tax=Colletotrichum siamense TaxID=690259 RepID=UPI0018727ED6|nr:Ribosome biogenesis protein nsa2 [Colletotrichum siamense]KAF5491620.1 Ribosome biogenesis protein nsa2 [Colletotrichum siamense]
MSTWNGGGSGMESVILVTEKRARKRLARAGHKQSHDIQSLRGIHAMMMQEKRRVGKIQMRNLPSDPVLHYLLDRNEPSATKALASSIKQRRNEKAARLNVTLPEVRGISEDEMFKVVTTGKKTHQRSWKRIVTKPIFVGEGFTRQNPKAERFIRFVDTSSAEGYRKTDVAFIL